MSKKPRLPEFVSEKIGSETEPETNTLASYLVNECLGSKYKDIELGVKLAASFDLVVASKFYQYVSSENWIWCEKSKRDYYAFLNACPYHVLENQYIFAPGHKPSSGQIGPSTAQAFRELVSSYFRITGKINCHVHNASEPIDLIVVDYAAKRVFIAEVKSAPLFTPPLSRIHTAESIHTTERLPLSHSLGNSRDLHRNPIAVFLPTGTNSYLELELPSGTFGNHNVDYGKTIKESLVKSKAFLGSYFSAWRTMWELYSAKNAEHPLYWNCGACGLPRKLGEEWPRQADGKPKGSISDSKTSVGLDRTDDIKKALFQVLKLGVDSRRTKLNGWEVLIGLASNVHAARHYEAYLQPYENIIWGWDDANSNKAIFNLFDGIVSFTRSHYRDQWLSSTLDWHVRGDNEKKN